MEAVIIISTYPNKESLADVAGQVVKEGLAACVNMIQIKSVYRWKGKIERGDEFMGLFKTTEKTKGRLKDTILQTHPYDVPEVVELDMNSVNESYLKWMVDSTV